MVISMKKECILDAVRFTFEYEEAVSIDFSPIACEDGIRFYRIAFDWGSLTTPKPIKLDWEIPAVDMYYMWDPLEKLRNISFNWRPTASRLPFGMPVKSMVSRRSTNRYLTALSDVKTPLSIRMRGNQYRPTIPVGIDFFTLMTGPFSSWECVLRIDERPIPFDEAVYDTMDWFASLGYRGEPIPEAALEPMYSTWYSYTQSISAEAALRECREAVRCGMETIIIDDGWHTSKYDSTYGHCGDWKPDSEKFPDMKGFVDEVHALGMKAMLWYATPFIGQFAERFAEFSDKVLRYSAGEKKWDLDPRYPDVRRYLIDAFVHGVRDWGFDGVKLDFINSFTTTGQYNDQMDFVSVEDATERLLSEIASALRAVNPDVLIEFRQPYFGPVVSTWGNMMRVWDCPLDSAVNRVQTVNLRLVSGSCAVHSDMMYWNPEDTPENVALQLWGTLFSVPQISARMEELSDLHRKVLANYLDFWNAHRYTLMHGRLKTTLCENGYGSVRADGEGESITMLSAEAIFTADSEGTAFAVNLTDKESLLIRNRSRRTQTAKVWDCTGQVLADALSLAPGLHEIDVPVGGRILITD